MQATRLEALEVKEHHPAYQISFRPSRNVRSSRPSRPVFRISSMNEPLLTEVLVELVAPGFAWCGVLEI
jgi:hypothetical protein